MASQPDDDATQCFNLNDIHSHLSPLSSKLLAKQNTKCAYQVKKWYYRCDNVETISYTYFHGCNKPSNYTAIYSVLCHRFL
jgi:hypothetical protein